jgi:hypothetical protein
MAAVSLPRWGRNQNSSRIVVLPEATARLERGAEAIRWMARARGVPVEIELRVSTYVDEPGRILTDGEALRIKGEFQRLEDLETYQRPDGR